MSYNNYLNNYLNNCIKQHKKELLEFLKMGNERIVNAIK